MSTRATYRINGSTFYIHHDGYPEYAVEYFKAALVNLIEDKDYTKWGLANSVTKIANTTESYDLATELETLGSQILSMQLHQFNRIAEAA